MGNLPIGLLVVPDDVRQEGMVCERDLADRVGGEAGEIEPVTGVPVEFVRKLPTVACDVDERRLFPEGTRGREDHRSRSGIFEAVG